VTSRTLAHATELRLVRFWLAIQALRIKDQVSHFFSKRRLDESDEGGGAILVVTIAARPRTRSATPPRLFVSDSL
jgi:hypothetical protein